MIYVQWHQDNRQLHIEIIGLRPVHSSLPAAILPAYDAESGRGWWLLILVWMNTITSGGVYRKGTGLLPRKR